MKRLIFPLISVFALSGISTADSFKFNPEDYRALNHVKSMVIFDKNHPLYTPFGGIHHVYVNNSGVKTIKNCNRRTFKDGTVLVFVLYENIEKNGTYIEGKKKIEAFMVKNSSKYKNTDGWGYFAYDSKGRNLVKNMKTNCHSCHSQAKNKDFVFSCWTK